MSSEIIVGRASSWSQEAASLLVTVIMPVRNEAAFIGRSLSSVLAQDFPMSQVEILVLDGMSEDGTRQAAEDFVRRFRIVHGSETEPHRTQRRTVESGAELPSSPGSVASAASVVAPNSVPGSFRIVDNPGRIVPTALNVAIRAARGQWLIRLDAHSIYPPDYLRLCVETARRTGADNVGGVFITLPRDESRQALLVQAITTSRFGVGNAEYRLDVGEGPADTVPYGCFRREAFTEIGLFDERLVRNQDYEFNRRLVRAGRRIWLNPAIQVRYHNQATLGGLFRQAFGTGKWNPWTWFVAPYAFAPRHIVPGLFVLSLLVALGLAVLAPWGWLALVTLLAPYLILALLSSYQQARRFGFKLLPFLPPLFFAYHASYGVGTLWGALRLLFGATPFQKIREPWPGAGRYRAWPNPDRRPAD